MREKLRVDADFTAWPSIGGAIRVARVLPSISTIAWETGTRPGGQLSDNALNEGKKKKIMTNLWAPPKIKKRTIHGEREKPQSKKKSGLYRDERASKPREGCSRKGARTNPP